MHSGDYSGGHVSDGARGDKGRPSGALICVNVLDYSEALRRSGIQ